MTHAPRNHVTDLRGLGRLAIDATAGITDLVESLHGRIASRAAVPGDPGVGRVVQGVAALAYAGVRATTRVVGAGLDSVLGALAPALDDVPSPPVREDLVAALNGVLGDYLAETHNPLALRMRLVCRRDGDAPDRDALAAAMPGASGHLLVLVHGLCRNHLQWTRRGHDHGHGLARDLGCTPVYAHYNSGLHVSVNGRALADHLERLVAGWPVPLDRIDFLAHSMGGLVVRSALHQARRDGLRWRGLVGKACYLGTPHHGAPLERGGQWIDVLLDSTPYSAPFTALGRIRSAGITDLRHGSLLDADWEGHHRFTARGDTRHPVPLADDVAQYVVAASTGRAPRDAKTRLLGDGLVPVASALGDHRDAAFTLRFPTSHRRIVYRAGHLDLLSSPDVYEQILAWLRP